ncbi:hypothetical protein A2U01_0111427, partial [Trifolium medium]|nr:hypothetical protein [Trifolium medium]
MIPGAVLPATHPKKKFQDNRSKAVATKDNV